MLIFPHVGGRSSPPPLPLFSFRVSAAQKSQTQIITAGICFFIWPQFLNNFLNNPLEWNPGFYLVDFPLPCFAFAKWITGLSWLQILAPPWAELERKGATIPIQHPAPAAPPRMNHTPLLPIKRRARIIGEAQYPVWIPIIKRPPAAPGKSKQGLFNGVGFPA